MNDVVAQGWEGRYASVGRLWSGRPSAWLAEQAAAWSPGRALDLGCGEGADALWLAGRGWQVTGVDLSATAVGRVLDGAAERGLSGQVEGLVRDLVADGVPAGPWDLVASMYLHDVPEAGLDVARVLAQAARGLAAGGHLLAATHAVLPPWRQGGPRCVRAQVLAGRLLGALGGDGTAAAAGAEVAGGGGHWALLACEERWSEVAGPDGQEGRRADALLVLERLAAPGDGPS